MSSFSEQISRCKADIEWRQGNGRAPAYTGKFTHTSLGPRSPRRVCVCIEQDRFIWRFLITSRDFGVSLLMTCHVRVSIWQIGPDPGSKNTHMASEFMILTLIYVPLSSCFPWQIQFSLETLSFLSWERRYMNLSRTFLYFCSIKESKTIFMVQKKQPSRSYIPSVCVRTSTVWVLLLSASIHHPYNGLQTVYWYYHSKCFDDFWSALNKSIKLWSSNKWTEVHDRILIRLEPA